MCLKVTALLYDLPTCLHYPEGTELLLKIGGEKTQQGDEKARVTAAEVKL